MSENSFGKTRRILKRAAYKKILRQGLKLHSKYFALFFLENGKNHHRLGLIVTKKIGNAVIRARIKRRIREYFRIYYPLAAQKLVPHDIVFLGKWGIEALTPNDIRGEVETLYEKHMYRFNQRVSKNPLLSVA